MINVSVIALIVSSIGLMLVLLIYRKVTALEEQSNDDLIREELRNARRDASDDARALREEIATIQHAANDALTQTVTAMGENQQQAITAIEQAVHTLRQQLLASQKESADALCAPLNTMGKVQHKDLLTVEARMKQLSDSNSDYLEKFRSSMESQMKAMQSGNEQRITTMQSSLEKAMDKTISVQQTASSSIEKRIASIADGNEQRLDKLRQTVDKQMHSLQESNEKKLEQMRHTVDEKLQSTLEKRLGESFKLVSHQLEAVQDGIGSMKNLTEGVGDLKRMLTNVKARGTWGEFQLGAILEQILTPEQYQKNVQPNPRSAAIVEYAICLPGQNSDLPIWLPIDSKFPQEDYLRLQDAVERADMVAVEKSTAALVRAVQLAAKDISDKYIEPPHTTDFAMMFLPTEGLYSEVLRQPGLVEKMQNDYRIVIAGPTTLSAILNSLRMGFRTLAIEKRSSEVWTILSAVKTEFGKFGDVLSKVKRQLDTASNTIEKTGVRTRSMERKLRHIEEMPMEESGVLLGLDAVVDDQPSTDPS